MLLRALLAAVLLAAAAQDQPRLRTLGSAGPSEEDVTRLLADWQAFGDALASIAPLEQVSVAAAEQTWLADDHVRTVLHRRGTTPDEFLGRYRRVSSAWWALLEQEAHD